MLLLFFSFNTYVHADLGVEQGDWVVYDVYASWSEPWIRSSLFDTYQIRMEVLEVLDNTVTVGLVFHYLNNTQSTSDLNFNTGTGEQFWIISANIEEGDTIGEITLNDTFTGTYASQDRVVNYYGFGDTFYNFTEVTEFYWDQSSGVLLELLMEVESPSDFGYINIFAVESNLLLPRELVMELDAPSSEVKIGEQISLTGILRDNEERLVEGATVIAVLYGDSHSFSDQGSGSYQVVLETSELEEDNYDIVVSAEKTGYMSTTIPKSISVVKVMIFPWRDYLDIILPIVAVLVMSIVFNYWKRRSKNKVAPNQIIPSTRDRAPPPRDRRPQRPPPPPNDIHVQRPLPPPPLSEIQAQRPLPPPPTSSHGIQPQRPPPPQAQFCTTCGTKLRWFEGQNNGYCDKCNEYK